MALLRSTVVLLVFALGSVPPVGAQQKGCPVINQDDTTGTVNARPPRHQRGPLPVHPGTAKARREGGTVDLIYVVGCDGKVDPGSLLVRDASDSSFIAPAVTAMIATQYFPAEFKGKKVAMRVMQRVNFHAQVYYDRNGKAVSMAEAEQMLVWTDANCELIPQDSLRRGEFPPGVEPVRYLSGGAPIYPRQMKQRMINGKVAMRFIVGCNGRVVPSSLVVISFTDTAFVGPGLAAIQTAQFAPARKDGVPAAQVVEQAIAWRMAGGIEPSRFPPPQPWWTSTCPANTCRSARP